MTMFFKEINSDKKQPGKVAWIHPRGLIAGVVDFGDIQEASDRVNELTSIWDSKELLTLDEALEIAKEHFEIFAPTAIVTLFQYEEDFVSVQSIGKLNLVNIGKTVNPIGQTTKLKLIPDEYFVVSPEPFKADLRKIDARRFEKVQSELEFASLSSTLMESGTWSMLMFPVNSTLTHINYKWPYNPFEGAQEERNHEKRGLARIAEGLFKDKTFNGFKIVGGQFFQHSNSSVMPDGMLVSPWGVFVLELKDHTGVIAISENSDNSDMTISKPGGATRREKNPIGQIMAALRSNYKELDLGINPKPRTYGLVVFTNPKANVTTVDVKSVKQRLPRDLGDVIVCTPDSIADAIKNKMKSIAMRNASTLGKSPHSATILSDEEIKKIVNALTRKVPAGTTTSLKRQHGRYNFNMSAIDQESNSFYKVYLGNIEGNNRKVWIKEYPLTFMDKGDGIQNELDRVRRELIASQDLPVSQYIQRGLDSWDESGSLFIALDYVEGLKLDTWLFEKKPSREKRLDLLVAITKTLSILSKERVVHRALTPGNIRISESGEHVLINFELCKLQNSATIVQGARVLLDLHYQAPEVLIAGRQVTSAADVYSFGKLACFVLSENASLPFASAAEQQSKMAKSSFWENINSHCGFAPNTKNSMQQILALDASKRPIGAELENIVKEWR